MRHRNGFLRPTAVVRNRRGDRIAVVMESDMRMLSLLSRAAGMLMLTGPVVAADPSAASRVSARASAQVVEGSAALLGAGSELTLAAVEFSGAAATLILRGATGSVTIVVQVSAALARKLAASVGMIVEAAATRAGHLLRLGGESIAFVLAPEAAGIRHRRTWP